MQVMPYLSFATCYNNRQGKEVSLIFKKHILKTSVVLNIVLLLFAGVVIYQKSGDIKQKVVSVFSNKVSTSTEMLPIYNERASLFSTLKPSPGSVVFLGDSITQYAEWDELFPNRKIINRGIGSDTTKGVIGRLDQIIQSQPSKVFLMIGINDLATGVSFQDIESNYEQILTKLEGIESVRIYAQSVLPINTAMAGNIVSGDKIIELNKRIASLSEKHNAKYVDLYSLFTSNGQMPAKYTGDGVHLTGEAYISWCNEIKQYVND